MKLMSNELYFCDTRHTSLKEGEQRALRDVSEGFGSVILTKIIIFWINY
jgi:hypothetical protein